MPLTNFTLKPGINKEVTDYTGQGQWVDSDNVRFFQGLPQKIKGWEKFIATTLVGVARDQHAWVTLDGTRYDAIGTDRKLYVLEEGVAYDILITGIRVVAFVEEATFENKPKLKYSFVTAIARNVGEKVDDLQVFNKMEFVNSLFQQR